MSYLCDMEVRAKKALGQHFLTDQSVATRIVGALQGSDVLEVGPGMGVLTQYLLPQDCVKPSTPLHPRGGLRGVPLRHDPVSSSTPLHPQGGLRGVPLRHPELQNFEGYEEAKVDEVAGPAGETTATLGTLRGGTGAERSEASGGAAKRRIGGNGLASKKYSK